MIKIADANKRIIRIHAIVWFCFILYETLIVRATRHQLPPILDYITHYSINIALFYFNAHVLLYYAFKQRRVGLWLLPIGVVLEIVLYLFILIFLVGTFYTYLDVKVSWKDPFYVTKSIWRAIYFIGFSTGYYFLITFIKEKERSTELEKQRLRQIIEQQKMERELSQAQNAYLRAQINPHFLFNTLNFIYNKTRKSAPIAADAILTLSAMMRYAVESSQDRGYILIEEELEQVNNLIHLHRLRQNQQIYLDISVDNTVMRLRIIPLILITLIENVFKHGNLALDHHPAVLRIFIDRDTLFIQTDNLVNAIHNVSGLSLGLENIAKRLEYNYGTEATFEYGVDRKNHFKTSVQIKLSALDAFAAPTTASDNIGK